MTSSSARRDLRDATGVPLAALLEENRENPRPGEAAVVATVVDRSQGEQFRENSKRKLRGGDNLSSARRKHDVSYSARSNNKELL